MIGGDISPGRFLERARDYAAALEVLKDRLSNDMVAPMGLLASQAIELGLKAYLLHSGCDEGDLKKIGHDLEAAWACAAESGLGLGTAPSFSVQVLSLSHNSPYLFRYPQDKVAVGITPPDALYMEVRGLLATVTDKIGEI